MRLEKDLTEPYEAWKAEPTPVTSGALLRAVDPIISTAMRTYSGGAGASPTLRSRARKLALDSFGTYDPHRGSMRNHLLGHLQRLRRYAGQQQVIPLPEGVALDRQHLQEAEAELSDKLARPPSDQELADHTGLSMRRLASLRQAAVPLAEGRLTQPGEEGRGGFDPSVQSLAPHKTDPWVELVYDDLGNIDRYILERSCGLHGHPPTSATNIAKALGISPAAVSQRMQRIQAMLDQRDELGGVF